MTYEDETVLRTSTRANDFQTSVYHTVFALRAYSLLAKMASCILVSSLINSKSWATYFLSDFQSSENVKLTQLSGHLFEKDLEKTANLEPNFF